MKQLLIRLLNDEKGQTLSEYVIAVIFIGLAAITAANLFPAALRAYLGRLFWMLSLPIP